MQQLLGWLFALAVAIYLRLPFDDLFLFSLGCPMPVASLPASAAPVTSPLAAPATAPITTSSTTVFALLITPGDERFLVDFVAALFLVALAATDFGATDFLATDFFATAFWLPISWSIS